MPEQDIWMAVFTGSKSSPRMKAWLDLPEAERAEQQRAGIAAWSAWMARHADHIVAKGGPLGTTKRVSANGVEDAVNTLAAYVVVRAPSHEAATEMFRGHPHFTIFPGDAVEVMPILAPPDAG